MGLFDNNLNLVVNYTYDSWGNVVSITGSMAETLGKDNPFRYRGYYYDNETNLYYLNSRYYDSNTGRFINADGLVQTGQGLLDKNMFAYCANNPIIYRDSSGQSYVITIPAEGSGAATVPTGYSVTSSKNSSGTYTYTVTPLPKVSTAGQNLIKQYDSRDGKGTPHLTAYRDMYGVKTIGWGHTGGMVEANVPDQITLAKAEQLFQSDLKRITDAANSYIIKWDLSLS